MKLLRSSTPWLFSLICGIGVVAVVGLGQRADRAKAAPVAANITQLSNVFRDVSKNVLPSVVSLRVKQKSVAGRDRAELEEFFKQNPEIPKRFREFLEQPGGVPSPRGAQGMGSGYIIDPRGVILTNHHVVKDAEEVIVRLHDGREFAATDIKGDSRTDVAIVRIQGARNLKALTLGDSDPVQVGDWVLAVGSPFGLDLSVTAGIISAKGRGPGIAEREDFLQTDAAINPGNSGGPLVDMSGHVIGMNTAIATSTRSSAGVGFAVPVNMVKWVSDQLIKDGRVRRAWLGVGVRPIDATLARELKIEIGAGAIIGQIVQDSPAAKAGLATRDVIQTFNGETVNGPRKLQSIVERLEVGKTYVAKIRREGKPRTIEIIVAEMPSPEKLRPKFLPER